MILDSLKKIQWKIEEDYKNTSLAKKLADFDTVYALQGEYIAGRVYKIHLDDHYYFLKKFVARKKWWVRIFSWSKIQSEYDNLKSFKRWSIPVANVVAHGQESISWMVSRGILITQELVNCFDLADIADHHRQLIEDPRWVAKVSHQLADATRKMHQHQFAHSDLKWRNIMVDIESQQASIYLIDCPAGMRWFRPFLEYRIIKDLACLDKRAKYELSTRQRLRFYKEYAQCNKLTAFDKQRIAKIMQFFHNRE